RIRSVALALLVNQAREVLPASMLGLVLAARRQGFGGITEASASRRCVLAPGEVGHPTQGKQTCGQSDDGHCIRPVGAARTLRIVLI
ncbi:MAG TPA: hypothetical protein VJ349_07555, partial [Stellaceae bacterium]|nr:hypothetical protein [Stellaceae bacterium]